MPTGNAEGFVSAKKAGRLGKRASRTGTRNQTQRDADTGFDGRNSVRLHLLGVQAPCSVS